MYHLPPINDTIEQIRQGNIAVLSRAITLVESMKETHQQLAIDLINAALPYTGNSLRIGITGVPGVGKSSFIEALGMYLIEHGKKVAVLAIDPSSSKSKGSILGDKTRMELLSTQTNAFIRPTSTGNHLGGVAYRTRETALLCEAAGFDVILIETVGVGQSEIQVADICDFFLLLMLTGAGDELQGIKRGIMEMADGVVITKADGTNIDKAKHTRAELARALHFMPPNTFGWKPQVLTASANDKIGIDTVWKMITDYESCTKQNHYFIQKRNTQNIAAFNKMLQQGFTVWLSQMPLLQQKKDKLLAQIQHHEISPYAAAIYLIKQIKEG